MSSNFQNPTDSDHCPEEFWQGQLQGMALQYGDSLRHEETVDLTPFLELLAQCVAPESVNPETLNPETLNSTDAA